MIRIGRDYAVLAIVLATVGALVLTFGQRVGLTELATGTIAGFVFALTGVVLYMGYDQAGTEREEQRRWQGVFKGIYLELLEFLEYLGDFYANDEDQELTYIPPLTRIAWDTAYTGGYIRPDDKFCQDLRHIYETVNHFNHLMNLAMDIRVKSTLAVDEQAKVESSLIRLLIDICSLLVPMITEAKQELETRLDISGEEVGKLKAELRERIRTLRLRESAWPGTGGRREPCC